MRNFEFNLSHGHSVLPGVCGCKLLNGESTEVEEV
jgi:hypothetical protein